MTKRQAYFWFAWFAFGSMAFTLVQDHLRPNYPGGSAVITYLLGVAPNYFAGLALSSFFVMMISQINSTASKPSPSPWLNDQAHLSSMGIAVLGLSLWECIQMYTPRGHFDWHDLLWTILGALSFYLIWLMVNRKGRGQ